MTYDQRKRAIFDFLYREPGGLLHRYRLPEHLSDDAIRDEVNLLVDDVNGLRDSEGNKVRTKVLRSLRKQTGTKVALINRETRTIRSSFSTLSYEIRARGDYLGLSHFNPRQFSYGVRAKPWGRSQRFGGAFVLGSASNNVFVNTRTFSPKSGRYNAIRKLFGPSIPKELVKDEAQRAFEEGSPDVLSEATRQLQRLIEGR